MVNGTPCVRLCVVEQRSHGRVSLVSLQILEESRLGTAQLLAHADRAELAAAAELIGRVAPDAEDILHVGNG